MRISWLSNAPWAATGYGNQVKVFAPRIKALGHELAITAFWGHDGTPINWDGIPVYGKGFHPYGQDIMAAHASNFKADILLSLMDAWVIQTALLQSYKDRWYPWFPIDHDPVPNVILNSVGVSKKPITMSKFGLKMMRNAGMDAYYVPHGVDTKTFKPMDKAEARKKMLLPNDVFIVGLVAANKGSPPRKAFFQQIAAFAEFHHKHDDTVLYIHSLTGKDGPAETVNLIEFSESQGLEVGRDVIFADQYLLMLGYPDEQMNALYNSFDVKMLVSMGEGFGIPLIEAQAAGCPVITGDWTAMGELCKTGWKIGKENTEKFWTPLASWQYLPHVGAITDALEAAYKYGGYSKDFVSNAVKEYDADNVTQKYWKPVLEDIALRFPAKKADMVAG